MRCYHSVLSCTQYAVGSNGTVEVQYSEQGGIPVVLVRSDELQGSGLCGYSEKAATPSSGSAVESSGTREWSRPWIVDSSGIFLLSIFAVGLLGTSTVTFL